MNNKIDELIKEVKEIQKELDYRTSVEKKAIKLIEQCKFDEAIKLLNTIQ